MSIEAMKQAIEALALVASDESDEGQVAIAAHEALRKAIKQADKQETTAWGMVRDGEIYDCITPAEHDREQGEYTVPLYAAPPQREWVGLTDEEMQAIVDRHTHHDPDGDQYVKTLAMVRDADKKLRDKNVHGWQSVTNPTEYLDDLRGGADEL